MIQAALPVALILSVGCNQQGTQPSGIQDQPRLQSQRSTRTNSHTPPHSNIGSTESPESRGLTPASNPAAELQNQNTAATTIQRLGRGHQSRTETLSTEEYYQSPEGLRKRDEQVFFASLKQAITGHGPLTAANRLQVQAVEDYRNGVVSDTASLHAEQESDKQEPARTYPTDLQSIGDIDDVLGQWTSVKPIPSREKEDTNLLLTTRYQLDIQAKEIVMSAHCFLTKDNGHIEHNNQTIQATIEGKLQDQVYSQAKVIFPGPTRTQLRYRLKSKAERAIYELHEFKKDLGTLIPFDIDVLNPALNIYLTAHYPLSDICTIHFSATHDGTATYDFPMGLTPAGNLSFDGIEYKKVNTTPAPEAHQRTWAEWSNSWPKYLGLSSSASETARTGKNGSPSTRAAY